MNVDGGGRLPGASWSVVVESKAETKPTHPSSALALELVGACVSTLLFPFWVSMLYGLSSHEPSNVSVSTLNERPVQQCETARASRR